MTASPGFIYSQHEGVGTIRLDREAQHNRIDPADLDSLRATLAEVARDESAIALVITGTGAKTFSSGYTLSALANGSIDRSFEAFLNELEALPVTTICALNGSVYGGATDLALCCDIRLGVEGSRMFMPAARIGLHYYPDGMRRYVRELGPTHAKRLLLTGIAIDAAEMLRIGYLTELVAADRLAERVDFYTDALKSCEADAVRSMKKQLLAIAAGDAQALTDRTAHEASLRDPRLAQRIAALKK
ncbi:enoyl-CoA hydratase/isomerase family protein [Paraburkholderia sp.]|uniref:enoyl-CoA hydratase/isomerase family protein n=1 Tax=Paraburkholderia sp. TaxID=1926495 RepID=UPI003D6F251C